MKTHLPKILYWLNLIFALMFAVGFIFSYLCRLIPREVGLPLIILGLAGFFLTNVFLSYGIIRKVCNNCHKNKTWKRNEEGLAVCNECENKLWEKELIDRAKDEPVLNCPIDGSAMDKLVLNGTEIVIDQCPKCKGAWLSKEKTEDLEEELR